MIWLLIFNFLKSNWRLVVGGILVLAAVFFIFQAKSCTTDYFKNKKIEKINANIQNAHDKSIESETVANIKTNEANQQKEVIKDVEKNTNLSRDNLNRAVDRDSSEQSDDFNQARRKFCQQFPDDSYCR